MFCCECFSAAQATLCALNEIRSTKTGIVMTKYWNFILLVAPVILVVVLLIVLPEIITNYAFIFVPMVALGMVIGALLVRGR